MDINAGEWIEIGEIVATQGLKGKVRVNSSTDFPERFERPGQRWLKRLGNQPPQPVELLGGYPIPGKNLYVVQIAGIEDIDTAETLRGCKLVVPLDDRPSMEEDEYHISDLINLEVYNQLTQEKIGQVINVFKAGNDLLEVKLDQDLEEKVTESDQTTLNSTKFKGRKKKQFFKSKKIKAKTILIPFVKEIVPVVDILEGRLEINPPSGLLELN